MKENAMKKAETHSLTDEQIAQLRALEGRRIDTDDIPEAPEDNWAGAERDRFFRPVKQAISIRLDSDVVHWFKRHSPAGRYQTEINRVLRQHVERSKPQKKPRVSSKLAG
jgi:uncharacterized protein (DUF4415 family)